MVNLYIFSLCLFVIVCSVQPAYVVTLEKFPKPAVIQITPAVDHSEEPTWDERTSTLYYVDTHKGNLYAFDSKTGDVAMTHVGGELTPIVKSVNKNHLIVGQDRYIVDLKWDRKNGSTAITKVIGEVSQDIPQSRLNEGKADKNGRLWIGTIGLEDPTIGYIAPNQGRVFRVTKRNLNKPDIVIPRVNESNGLAWNKANNKFYYIDSLARNIVEYEYEETSGSIFNPRIILDLTEEKFANISGDPDGMTIDEDDNLWIALYNGGSVIKVNPSTGVLLQVVPLPARGVTSCIWGGPNMDILFVSTSRVALSEMEKKQYPGAGSVYAVTNLGTRGLTAFAANLIT